MKRLLMPFLSVLIACAAESQPVVEDPEDEATTLEQDDSLADGKMDSASVTAARARRFRPVGHLRFGDIGRAENTPQAAWSFYARGDTVIQIDTWGAGAVRLSGPKSRGADWPVPFVPDGGEISTQTVTLPDDGLYAVQLDAPEGSEEALLVQLSCDNQDCTLPTWRHDLSEGALALVAVGDLGLTVSQAPLDSDGGFRNGKF